MFTYLMQCYIIRIMKKDNRMIDEYIAITADLLQNENVKLMKTFNHHGKINTHFHSVYVSYDVLRVCNALKVNNKKKIVRAALLHDFYLYDWHTEKHDEMHAWYHPKAAVVNIEREFGELSEMQKDMILRHMFPLSIQPPNSVGGWILTLCDKHCANEDIFGVSKRFVPVYDEINRRCDNNG